MKRISFLLLAVAVVAVPAGYAGASQDASKNVPLPALASAKAHRSLLLDVARAGTRLVAVGERGHIVFSDDQGVTWQQAASPTRALLTAVYFANAKQGWAVGHDATVLATADGGSTWQLQYHQQFVGGGDPTAGDMTEDDLSAADHAASADDAVADAAMSDESGVDAAMGEASDDGSMDDEGFAEDEAGGGGRAVGNRVGVPLLDVWFADDHNGIAVGAYGLMLKTGDGGKTWRDVSDLVVNRDGWHFNAIGSVPGNAAVVIVASERGKLYRSTNGGASFAAVTSPYDGSFFGLAGASNGMLYAFGLQGRLYRSADDGIGWVQMDTGVTSGLNGGCQAADGTMLVVGNAGVVLSGKSNSKRVGRLALERRPDRQSIMSCVSVGNGVVLVGEGGVQIANTSGRNP